MKKDSLTAFYRVFKYVWPQWGRIVTVVLLSIVIAILFSVSFATIIPLLKVMMNEEGIHAWVDRSHCKYRYGMDFRIPNMADLQDDEKDIVASSLLVTKVGEDCLAMSAGVNQADMIVGAGSFLVDEEIKSYPSSKLLEELATTTEDKITIQLLRYGNDGVMDVEIETWDSEIPFADGSRLWLIEKVQRWISFMPRDQARENQKKAITAIIMLMMIVTVLRCVARFYQSYTAEKISQTSIAGLREDMFWHIMHMPVGFFSSEGTSDTVSRLIGDTSASGKGIKILFGKMLREPAKAMGTLTVAMLINWKLALIFICGAPAMILMFAVFGKKIRKATKKSLMSSAAMLGRVQGSISGLRVVKVYNQQDRESDAYNGVNKRFLRQMLRAAKIQAMTNPLMEVLGMFAMMAALMVGVHWVFGKGMASSAFFALLASLGSSADSLRKVSDVWNNIQQSNAAAERVFEVIDTAPETDKPGAGSLGPVRESIEFKDIVFSYPGSAVDTLKGVNLTVNAGETVAVVGPNGSGKTTLINLITRFYDVKSGAILVDGVDIRDLSLRSLRDQIGMVTQNVVTFNDSVAANISYSKPSATIEEIIKASKSAYSHEFVAELPDGYDTEIGENSTGFSGGQLQRIVIARAILNDPSILIFDEAMSQIDADSEAKIHSALSELMCQRTCFVIAHRFSTVISADRIVVMEDGRIAASGTHSELMKKCGLYRNLYETQLMSP